MSATEWSELAVTGLPTGTVTLLLADVEGSTRLWDTQPDAMSSAIARLDDTLAGLVAAHNGVRPVEQGEGDSFVLAFARASDAVACALALQRAPLAPIRLRIGINTGEIQLRDEGNYIGPTINRTARLRDLAHGGQTVLSGATEPMVLDFLPDGAWLTDLGTHPLRDLPRPERVVQLCHPDIHNDFPPLRVVGRAATQNLPAQLSSFVGRTAEMASVRELLSRDRLVTLTGAGGSGKTRLAVEIAAAISGEFAGGVWYVDLAPITNPDVVPVTVARALGLPDQPGSSSTESVVRHVGENRMLIVLDNCEHLLDASATMIEALLRSCPSVTLLATSREPIGMPGELTWRVPSLPVETDAVELFAERARKVRSDFQITEANASGVAEICRRLDGMPLAIELAAARVRALSITDLLASLHDRFRLLTGGARTAVRRQQTLRASVDWSHALLTEPEQVLFRRLAAFMGGFDLDAAEAVGGGGDVERYQVLDQLTLLVDKSLVVIEGATEPTRYRLLETVRQYALEKLGESGEADVVRTRHRDHYAAMASRLDTPTDDGHEARLDQAALEIDNLRAAFQWCRENADTEQALSLVTSLQALWLARGQIREGLAGLEIAIADHEAAGDTPTTEYARALADKAMLDSWLGAYSLELAEAALDIARNSDDATLLIRALIATGCVNGHNAIGATPYFAEALELALTVNDTWRISQILGWQAYGAMMRGDCAAANAIACQGIDFAGGIGNRFVSRQCRWILGLAKMWGGELVSATAQFAQTADEAEAAHDALWAEMNIGSMGYALSCLGDTEAAEDAARKAIDIGHDIGGLQLAHGFTGLALAAFARGDGGPAADALELASPIWGLLPEMAAMHMELQSRVALLCGDHDRARRLAEEAVPATKGRGWHHAAALLARARLAIVDGAYAQAEDDLHAAIAEATAVSSYLDVPEMLEYLAHLAALGESPREAARLFGAAETLRISTGAVPFADVRERSISWISALRDMLDDSDFEAAWAEGAALSTEEAIAYAQRGRGARKRPSSGWGSLTPAELDVVRLVSEGLANRDIATRLFISPRTVQTHLTHVYTKLGLTSRVQLAQEAARRG
ncbi:LuxR family transcriptional regulator [Mycolicibacterium gadium]|uniref:LuxR C-terminal-related transcriptional regulator n=1 Tax=Mycolicibacterium gadium TaxID=1794 RepID=A0ABT6GL37_MYCGU|nr:LuxR family transcriptional regulator [Mycolicibacterium gadium]MDG5482125.1 LuxR C-terminal-related transcriptional regulator [Mycolicibacterium gadium]